jgi:hypothetical protein
MNSAITSTSANTNRTAYPEDGLGAEADTPNTQTSAEMSPASPNRLVSDSPLFRFENINGLASFAPAIDNLDAREASLGMGFAGDTGTSSGSSSDTSGLNGQLASAQSAKAAGITSAKYESLFAAARDKRPTLTQADFDKFILPSISQVGQRGLDDAIQGAFLGYDFVRSRFDTDKDTSNIPGHWEIGIQAAISGATNASDPAGVLTHSAAFVTAAESAVIAWRSGGLY